MLATHAGVYEIVAGNVDICVSDFWETTQRRKLVAYTTAFDQDTVRWWHIYMCPYIWTQTYYLHVCIYAHIYKPTQMYGGGFQQLALHWPRSEQRWFTQANIHTFMDNYMCTQRYVVIRACVHAHHLWEICQCMAKKHLTHLRSGLFAQLNTCARAHARTHTHTRHTNIHKHVLMHTRDPIVLGSADNVVVTYTTSLLHLCVNVWNSHVLQTHIINIRVHICIDQNT